MPTNDNSPEVMDDEALTDIAGGRKTLQRRETPEQVGMFPPGVGDLKPAPTSPVPIPYPTFPNTKD